ncbi:MAG TPA: Mov34/MPN/PAD-1 family protein [Thermoplasmata archaeon]|nr:Mov34/MPN/PAD-1 family protein [Thermoplasmata archaeon]
MRLFRPTRRRRPGDAPFGTTPRKITRRCLDAALACARSAYPREFGGVLRADTPGVITELLLLPGTTAGPRHANFQLYMLPVDLGVAGTVHSHPSGALHPSEADLTLFRHWGQRHLILGNPFEIGDWRAYDGNGEETPLQVLASASGGAETVLAYRPRVLHPPRGPVWNAPETE